MTVLCSPSHDEIRLFASNALLFILRVQDPLSDSLVAPTYLGSGYLGFERERQWDT